MKAWLLVVAVLASSPAWADDTAAPAAPAPTPAPAPAPTPAPAPSSAPGATQPDFVPVIAPKDIVITTEGERSRKNIELVAGIAIGSAVLLGVGLYFNLDSQSAANAISANTGDARVWSPADRSDYDRAHDSAIKAGVFYGVGGAALITAIVALIATAPNTEQTVIHPHVAPTVAPAPGGAVLGGAWSF